MVLHQAVNTIIIIWSSELSPIREEWLWGCRQQQTNRWSVEKLDRDAKLFNMSYAKRWSQRRIKHFMKPRPQRFSWLISHSLVGVCVVQTGLKLNSPKGHGHDFFDI